VRPESVTTSEAQPHRESSASAFRVSRAGDAHASIAPTITITQTVAAIGVSAAGLLCMQDQLRVLWNIWMTDGLRSIGILIPIVSVALTIRAWRGCDFFDGGRWWGLAPIVAAIVIANVASYSMIALYTMTTGPLPLFPTGLLIWMYVSGAVILFVGVRAWRAAAFPIALLLLVNPVPGSFSTTIDIQLQYLAAHVARDFAAWLGVAVTGDRLRMLFSPAFGMFIAPGCDGLRGAVAMAYVALIAGYLSGLTKLRHALFVASALMLGYLFNLIRLCALVLFYWMALKITPLQGHAEAADYLIGAVLFFVAAAFLMSAPRLRVRISSVTDEAAAGS
jgi:exosortase J